MGEMREVGTTTVLLQIVCQLHLCVGMVDDFPLGVCHLKTQRVLVLMGMESAHMWRRGDGINCIRSVYTWK